MQYLLTGFRNWESQQCICLFTIFEIIWFFKTHVLTETKNTYSMFSPNYVHSHIQYGMGGGGGITVTENLNQIRNDHLIFSHTEVRTITCAKTLFHSTMPFVPVIIQPNKNTKYSVLKPKILVCNVIVFPYVQTNTCQPLAI